MSVTKLIMCTVLLSVGLWAQGIAPPIAQFRGDKVDGMFEVQNNTDYAMAVLLATQSFDVDEHGQVRYRPLDAGIQIKMGASSFVLRPNDKRMVFYKASFPAVPTSFSITATMTKAKSVTDALRINFIFPHMVYVYQKAKLDRSDIKIELVNGILLIHNLSNKLGRIEEVQASKQDLGGFPIYPGQTREVVATGATKATVKFEDGFKIETP